MPPAVMVKFVLNWKIAMTVMPTPADLVMPIVAMPVLAARVVTVSFALKTNIATTGLPMLAALATQLAMPMARVPRVATVRPALN